MKKISKQPYRLWFDYLKTALANDMKVDEKYYKSWHLNSVRTQKFDQWFKNHQHLFQEYDSDMDIVSSKSNRSPDNVYVSIPKNYSVKRVQREIGALIGQQLNKSNATFKITSNRTLMIAPMDYMLWCWQYRQMPKYQVHGGLDMIHTQLQNKVANRQAKVKNKKKVKRRIVSGDENGAIMVSKNVRKAERILKNVCKGVFPGQYSIS